MYGSRLRRPTATMLFLCLLLLSGHKNVNKTADGVRVDTFQGPDSMAYAPDSTAYAFYYEPYLSDMRMPRMTREQIKRLIMSKTTGRCIPPEATITDSTVVAAIRTMNGKMAWDPYVDSTDYNFDNYPDFSIYNRNESGVHNVMREIFIYDPAKKEYVYHDKLSGMGNVYADKDMKIVRSFWSTGGVDRYIIDEHEWYKGELKPIRREESDRIDSLGVVVVKTDSLRNGVWMSRTDTISMY